MTKFQEGMADYLRGLRKSGQSEAIAIADVLDGAIEEGQLDEGLAIAILEQFEEIARSVKREVLATARARRRG
jgi:hypothetical protein